MTNDIDIDSDNTGKETLPIMAKLSAAVTGDDDNLNHNLTIIMASWRRRE
jgi:hypothetical protein